MSRAFQFRLCNQSCDYPSARVRVAEPGRDGVESRRATTALLASRGRHTGDPRTEPSVHPAASRLAYVAALDPARGMMGLRMPPAAELCAPHSTSERGLKRAYANELAMRRRQQKGRTLASLVGSDPATLPALVG